MTNEWEWALLPTLIQRSFAHRQPPTQICGYYAANVQAVMSEAYQQLSEEVAVQRQELE